MIYKTFKDKKLSRLGFGTMRLPLLDDQSIDQEQVEKMVDYAMEHGINYFDTAYPYHGGYSEISIGKALKKYPRESFYLANKFPGHQTADFYDPMGIFEEQLKKCQVDYFDFYLLHNVMENTMDAYESEKWGIIDYFVEQKRLGRIKHLGFSSHARPENLKAFIERHLKTFDFCQIQLNYLDWTLQDAKQKVEILNGFGLPIWVMEPVHGGKLVNLPQEEAAKLKTLRPNQSIASWGFRWLQSVKGVTMILSGMSSFEQMVDNVSTFEKEDPTNESEIALLFAIADVFKNSIPCTACRYCVPGCPMGLNIPLLIASYNDIKFAANFTVGMQMDALKESELPSACIACGACKRTCPQKIDVPNVMSEFAKILANTRKWDDISRERNAAAAELSKQFR